MRFCEAIDKALAFVRHKFVEDVQSANLVLLDRPRINANSLNCVVSLKGVIKNFIPHPIFVSLPLV